MILKQSVVERRETSPTKPVSVKSLSHDTMLAALAALRDTDVSQRPCT